MRPSGTEPGTPRPGGPRIALGLALLVLLAGYAALLFYGIGVVPETFDLAWYDPRSFLIYDLRASRLAPLANEPRLGLVVLSLPALGLAVGAGLLLRSALMRVVTLSLFIASFLILTFGLLAPEAWRFFQWRFSSVLLVFSLAVAAGLLMPLLAASWLRLGWGARLAVYVPLALAVTVLIRNATGTDLSAPLNVSLWPAVPFFGIQLVSVYVAALYAGVGLLLAGWLALRAQPAAATAALAAGLALLGYRLVTSPSTGWGFALALLALGLAGAWLVSAVVPSAWQRRAGRAAMALCAGAALLALPVTAGEALVERDIESTREGSAQRIIDALAEYYEDEQMYPDDLERLVREGYLERVPEPDIGFEPVSDGRFMYDGFGGSYLLSFAAAGWMQCQYSPPYLDLEEEELEEEPEGEDGGDVNGVWQCPKKPPEMW